MALVDIIIKAPVNYLKLCEKAMSLTTKFYRHFNLIVDNYINSSSFDNRNERFRRVWTNANYLNYLVVSYTEYFIIASIKPGMLNEACLIVLNKKNLSACRNCDLKLILFQWMKIVSSYQGKTHSLFLNLTQHKKNQTLGF